jgi:protein gp37
MSANSTIAWTDKTWNPLLGCERVSAGCDACYAINTAHIRASNPNPKIATAFAGLTERRDGRTDWTGRVNLLADRLAEPLGWRKPALVFVNSQADLFHDQVPDEFIAEVIAVMALARQHTFQVLTKRHARMRSLLNRDDFRKLVQRAALTRAGDRAPWLVKPWWPLRNLWLGVSVEDQRWANIRIPVLLDTRAAVRWISAEPLLGPVDLHYCAGVDALERDWIGGPSGGTGAPHPFLDWVVVGGESGHDARPMDAGWARSLRDQCTAAGVPFFFKQLGSRLARDLGVPGKGEDFEHLPAEFQIRQYPQAVTVGA